MTPIKKRVIQILGFPLFSLVLLSSCVTSQRDVLYLNDQILALNEKVNKLQQSMDKKLSGDVDNRLASVRDRNAELLAEMDKIRGAVQNLSGRVDENAHLVKRSVERDTTQQDTVAAGIADLTQRVNETDGRVKQLYNYLKLELPAGSGAQVSTGGSPQGTSPATSAQTPPAAQPTVAAPPAPQKSPEVELYDSSLSEYKGGNYEKAIVGFKRFLDEYSKSKLAENAQFWIGESFMGLKQYEQAILAYQQVIKSYPNGAKVPGALLRQGLAFHELKDDISYKLLLQKVVKQFPSSSEAEIAKSKLKTIK